MEKMHRSFKLIAFVLGLIFVLLFVNSLKREGSKIDTYPEETSSFGLDGSKIYTYPEDLPSAELVTNIMENYYERKIKEYTNMCNNYSVQAEKRHVVKHIYENYLVNPEKVGSPFANLKEFAKAFIHAVYPPTNSIRYKINSSLKALVE